MLISDWRSDVCSSDLSVLDLLFTVVFLAVMFFYSGWLTLIVVLALPLYALISAAITPSLRRRLNEKFARGADNQAFLVETVTGIGTVDRTSTRLNSSH